MAVFDVFMFLNEFDLLRIRLNELKNVVTTTILIESGLTHSGKPKPYFFEERKEEFKDFNIVHLKVPAEEVINPPVTEPDYPVSRLREKYQRNYAVPTLKALAKPEDLILFSDVDEIYRAEAVKRAITQKPGRNMNFAQTLYYYYLNGRAITSTWDGAVAFLYKDLFDDDLAAKRTKMQADKVIIPNGGWHFSYLGGIQAIQQKVTSFCHTEFDLPEYVNDEHIAQCLADGTDLYNRGSKINYCQVDSSYPAYLLNHIEAYAQYIHQ